MGIYIKNFTKEDLTEMLYAVPLRYKVPEEGDIIEVAEPHGRLIEVTDKLRSELCWYEAYTGIDEAPIKYAVSLIDDAPTVIESEE